MGKSRVRGNSNKVLTIEGSNVTRSVVSGLGGEDDSSTGVVSCKPSVELLAHNEISVSCAAIAVHGEQAMRLDACQSTE
jgi:hypothetical protein